MERAYITYLNIVIRSGKIGHISRIVVLKICRVNVQGIYQNREELLNLVKIFLADITFRLF